MIGGAGMKKNNQSLKILMIASECTPIVKAGGLGDVIGALPKNLDKMGHQVRIILPRYYSIDLNRWGFQKIIRDVAIKLPNGKNERITVYRSFLPDTFVPIYLIENKNYFQGSEGGPYKFSGKRGRLAYVFLSRAALELLKIWDWQPDVVHCHDHMTAIAAKWLHTINKDDPFYQPIASVLTIHNTYQGSYKWYYLKYFGLSKKDFEVECKYVKLKGISVFAAGIEAADMINTVSPTYAHEITTKKYGAGLYKLFRTKRGRLFGILNGIDYGLFDPRVDENVICNYDEKHLEGKIKNKLELQKKFGLPQTADLPLICIVSRMTAQKGLDLFDDVLKQLMDMGAQFIILGSGQDKIEKIFVKAEKDYPKQVATNIEFNADLAQFVYAGSDMLLMPSKFEPCGLSQIIAMRFGTIPLVRKTGGLADTVRDHYTGFVFKDYDAHAMLWVIRQAVDKFYNDKEGWKKMIIRCMKKDFSWKASAKRYVRLYKKAISYHNNNHMKDDARKAD